MTTSYAILTTVSLRHDYYADGRCPDFDIRPTEDTLAAMRGLFILWRMLDDTLVLLLKVDEAGKAFQGLPPGLKLSFYLELSNPDFINYSNAPAANGRVCYASNIFHNEVNSTRFLNSPLPAFSAATDYAIGDMVSAGGSIFEAIKPVSAGSHATGDADYWQQRASAQYIHPGDLVSLSDGNLRLHVAAASSFVVDVFALNVQTRVFDVPVISEQLTFLESITDIALALRHLPPARYRLVVNGVEQFIYVDAAASYARPFGIIELYNCFDAADDFGWLNAAGIPKGVDHELRFANRLAIWKYIARTANVTAIENTAEPNAFEAGDRPKEFVSRKPLFLQQQPVKTLKVMSGSQELSSRAANPQPSRIATCTDDGNEYYCAEIYLDY